MSAILFTFLLPQEYNYGKNSNYSETLEYLTLKSYKKSCKLYVISTLDVKVRDYQII